MFCNVELKAMFQVFICLKSVNAVCDENLLTKWVKVVNCGKKMTTFAKIIIISILWRQ